MKSILATSLLLAGILLLNGCHQEAGISPVVERPLVERGIVQLAGRADAPVRIPTETLVMLAGTPGVFILSGERARFRMVKSGKRQGNEIEVISGLEGNETLIMPPYEGVYDGSPARPVTETSSETK